MTFQTIIRYILHILGNAARNMSDVDGDDDRPILCYRLCRPVEKLENNTGFSNRLPYSLVRYVLTLYIQVFKENV